MRIGLKIADIYLDFTYCYNDYFGDKITAYEFKGESITYKKLVVKVEAEIHLPDRPITLKHENRVKQENEFDTYIAVFVKEEIKYLIYYKNDFSDWSVIDNIPLSIKKSVIDWRSMSMF